MDRSYNKLKITVKYNLTIMKELLKFTITILLAFLFAFTIYTSSNANISTASYCNTECLGGVCSGNPEGGINCVEKVRDDGFPYCENRACSDLEVN